MNSGYMSEIQVFSFLIIVSFPQKKDRLFAGLDMIYGCFRSLSSVPYTPAKICASPFSYTPVIL